MYKVDGTLVLFLSYIVLKIFYDIENNYKYRVNAVRFCMPLRFLIIGQRDKYLLSSFSIFKYSSNTMEKFPN